MKSVEKEEDAEEIGMTEDIGDGEGTIEEDLDR